MTERRGTIRGKSQGLGPAPPTPGNVKAASEARALFSMPGRQKALSRILGIAFGLSLGIGSYTFYYAQGMSYLGTASTACANCHVMQGHLDAWTKSSHRAVATCNDCHTPHNIVGKYVVKARNGYHHSVAFTTGRFHEPIQITDAGRTVVEQSCRHCHADVVQMMDYRLEREDKVSCLHCHGNVGHL